MASSREELPAPPVIRSTGYYIVILGALSLAFVFGMRAGLHESELPEIHWYNTAGYLVLMPSGVGLVFRQRWAYVIAVVLALGNTAWLANTWATHDYGDVVWAVVPLFMMVEIGLAAVPLRLLGKEGRAWFQRRDLEITGA